MKSFLRAKGVTESLSMLLPVTLYYLVWILVEILVFAQKDMPSINILFWAFLGYLAWTLCEYIGHRYIEHRPLDGKKSPAWLIDWFPHVEHHRHPEVLDDIFEMRQSSLIVACVGLVFMLLSGDMTTTCILHIGFILGYLGYEWIHIGGHCPIMGKTRLLKFLFKNHHRHHTVNGNRFYGTSGPLWDVVFRTYR